MSIRRLSTSTLTQQTRYATMSTGSKVSYSVPFLVIAGGGGGDGTGSGSATIGANGGGAGGYRCSVSGESSGGGASAETPLTLLVGTSYSLEIGAGGDGYIRTPTVIDSTDGNDSTFASIVSTGGGKPLNNGGSGGGNGGLGTAGQGFDGEIRDPVIGGGGGGAGEDGGTDGTGFGGDGVSSSINGVATFRAGGGGGGRASAGNAGDGGGGEAPSGGDANGGDAAVNTGGGGAGGCIFQGGAADGGNGGSGIILFRLPSTATVSFSGGVTQTSTIVGDDTCYTVTAAGPTDTVTITA